MSWIREQFIVDGHTRATNAAISAAAKHAQNANEWAEYARGLEDYSEELKVEIANLKSEVTAYKEQSTDAGERVAFLMEACGKKNAIIQKKDAQIEKMRKIIVQLHNENQENKNLLAEHGISDETSETKPERIWRRR